MEEIGYAVLAWFLFCGTAILAAICAAVAVGAGLLCLVRVTTRRRFFSLLGLLAAEIFLIGNVQFNMWLFDAANKRAFEAMCEALRQEEIEGKTKRVVASRVGKPWPFSISRVNGLERWSYRPGPFLSYGSMNSVIIEFKNDIVTRWYVDWF